MLEAVQLRVSQIEIYDNKEKDQLVKDSEVYIEWANGNEEFAYIFLEKNNTKQEMLKNEDYRTYDFLKDINHLIEQVDSKYVMCADLSFNKFPLKTVRIIVPEYQDIDNKNRKITDRLLNVLEDKEINNQ